jgi:hypothetical protein
MSSFSGQVADKFNQQVIDNEQKNSLNAKSYYSSDIKINLVEQDTSDAHDTNVKGKHANIVFHLDSILLSQKC